MSGKDMLRMCTVHRVFLRKQELSCEKITIVKSLKMCHSGAHDKIHISEAAVEKALMP